MKMQEKDQVRNAILQSADKHPNSRVSKLIRNVEAERSQKNIVLLLIELAEHTEYATDFSISLKYYLDLFDHLGVGREIVLNEAGLLLLSSSKVYGRRVDYVQELVERQIINLNNSEKEVVQTNTDKQCDPSTAEKPKRGRKRLLPEPKDPYEIELVPKKFRKISSEKRFAANVSSLAAAANKKKISLASMRQNEAEDFIHPAGWLHAHIVDLENAEDIDSKRNYKLFTHHIEHRYNTLVNDINFRLHFMVKDFIDAEEERMEEDKLNVQPISWPPLSEAYVEQYLNLEDRILHKDKEEKQTSRKRKHDIEKENSKDKEFTALNNTCALSSNDTKHLTNAENVLNIITNTADKVVVNNSEYLYNDSALGESIVESNIEESENSVIADALSEKFNCEQTKRSDFNENAAENSLSDSAIGESMTVSMLEESSIVESESNVNSENANMSLKDLATDGNGNSSEVQQDSILEESLKDSIPVENPIKESEVKFHDGDTVKDDSNEKVQNESNEENINSSTISENQLGQEVSDLNNSQADSICVTNESTIINDNNEGILQTNGDTTLKSSEKLGIMLKNCSEGYFSEEFNLEDTSYNKNKLDTDTRTAKASEINLKINDNHDNNHADIQFDIGEIRIHLPHLDDEGVFFSDLDEQEQRMLSPTVMATDVFPSLPNKENFTIIIDDDIRAMLDISDDEAETYKLPVKKRPNSPTPVKLNIMKFHEKFLQRRVLFKLGPEYDLYMQARKRTRTDNGIKEYREPKQMKLFEMSDSNISGSQMSPVKSTNNSPDFNGFCESDTDTDFAGFDENEHICTDGLCKTHRLSRDSGVGVDAPMISKRPSLEVVFEETSMDINLLVTCKNDFKESEIETSKRLEDILDEVERIIEVNEIEPLSSSHQTEKGDADSSTTDHIKTSEIETTKRLEEILDTVERIIEANETEQQSLSNQTENARDADSSTTDHVNTHSSLDIAETNVEEKQNASETTTAVLETQCDSVDLNEEIPCSQSLQTFRNEPSDEIEKPDCNTELNPPNLKSTLEVPSDEKLERIDFNAEIPCSQSLENVTDDVDATEFSIGGENDMMKDIRTPTVFNLDITSTKTKIQQWHEHLQPILSKSRERHHFDVFQIGTEIIDEFEHSGSENCDPVTSPSISFQDVMENKDASFVSRYFLSSLLLANQSNIKIAVKNKSSEQPSAWKDIQFDLISTKRHTISIEDNIGMVTRAPHATTSKAAKTKAKTNKTLLNCPPAMVAPNAISVVDESSILNVNLRVIKPFKQIGKSACNGDDYDSGIFSSEELT